MLVMLLQPAMSLLLQPVVSMLLQTPASLLLPPQPAVSLFRCTSGPGAVPASSLPPDWQELHCTHQLAAFLCVPLTHVGGKVVGTLTLASGDGESCHTPLEVVSHESYIHNALEVVSRE